ncbi:MAG: stage II sporulation protein M [Nitrososphaerota archaeon]|jgi:hypothetical protein|nr:stage II sporulation protein M [Nitrososphaerota archaeon]
MKYLQFWHKTSSKRKRIYSVAIMLILAILSTIVGTLIPPSPEDAQLINDQLNQTLTKGLTEGTLNTDIFLNNFPLCLLMFIPLIGCFIGMYILFSTGQALRAGIDLQMSNGMATATSDISITATTIIILLIGAVTVFLIEYLCYSIAMSESIWVFRRILQKKGKRELKWLIILIGITALLLTIGALVETFTLTP